MMAVCCIVCIMMAVYVTVEGASTKKRAEQFKYGYMGIEQTLKHMTIKLVDLNDDYLELKKDNEKTKELVGTLVNRVEDLERDNKILKKRLKLYDTIAEETTVVKPFVARL